MRSSPRVRFFITGYGKFADVDVNPSGRLVENFVAADEHRAELYDVASCVVLHSSNASILTYLNSLESPTNDSDFVDVFLSIGVRDNISTICLEKNAFNEMDYPFPDEDGVQPRDGAKICEDGPLMLSSALRLDDAKKTTTESTIGVDTSEDAGRFMCNFIFYGSLQKNPNSVFVHVPTFEVCDEEDLLSGFKETLHRIAMLLSS